MKRLIVVLFVFATSFSAMLQASYLEEIGITNKRQFIDDYADYMYWQIYISSFKEKSRLTRKTHPDHSALMPPHAKDTPEDKVFKDGLAVEKKYEKFHHTFTEPFWVSIGRGRACHAVKYAKEHASQSAITECQERVTFNDQLHLSMDNVYHTAAIHGKDDIDLLFSTIPTQQVVKLVEEKIQHSDVVLKDFEKKYGHVFDKFLHKK